MPSSLQSPRWALSRGSINTSRLIKPLIASCLEFSFHTDLRPRMPWKTCTKRMRVGSGLSWTLLTQTPGQPQYWFFSPRCSLLTFFFNSTDITSILVSSHNSPSISICWLCFQATDGNALICKGGWTNPNLLLRRKTVRQGAKGFLQTCLLTLVLYLLLCMDTYVCMHIKSRGQLQMSHLRYFVFKT